MPATRKSENHGRRDMFNAPTDEEIKLRTRARRRLIGAVSLVTLLFIALPLLLERAPQPENDANDIRVTQLNANTNQHSRSDISGSATGTRSTQALTREGAAKQNPVTADPDTTGTPSATRRIDKPADASVSASRAPAVANTPKSEVEQSYVVQLGAFANPANAKQLQQRLAASGIKSYVELFKTPDGNQTRVRAGPFETRDAAEKTRDRLSDLGLPGVVAPK